MIGARSTYFVPSGNSTPIRPATSTASRVLPEPPEPVRVMSQCSERTRRMQITDLRSQDRQKLVS